jgi:phage terminase large subunit-like protein
MADSYVEDVLSGRIVAGQWTQKACRRFVSMRTAAAAFGKCDGPDAFSFSWSPDHVNEVCAWIEQLPHVEGRWSTATITLQPWQVFILAACYGFRRANGSRLVTTVFFEVGRKSAKSTLVAACGLYHLAVEDEPGAQVICGASTGNQSRIVFSIMQRMVRRASWLRDLGFVAYANAICLGETGGTARPINSKSSTQDGLNPSFISLDESHAQTFELHDVLKSAQGGRSDPMLWAPTTAGYSLTSIGYALRSTAMKILDGIDAADHVFCILYELDESDDWRDETCWIKALPMIGISPSLDYVRRYCIDAQQTPGLQGEFETKVCNRWLHSANRWLSMPAWNACADRTLRLEDFQHERCFIGIDLAERDDISAVALCFLREDLLYIFCRGYLPAGVVQERSRAVPLYAEWLRQGELIATDGTLTDYGRIEADLRQDCETYDVVRIVFERFGAAHLAGNLVADGLPAMVESKNTRVFTPPAKEFEARLKAGKLRHTGSSFLAWQVSNVCVERRRDGTLLPTKEGPESPLKIDAIDSICLGLHALLREPTVTPPSPRLWMLEA